MGAHRLVEASSLRGATIIEAVVALALGAGGGAGFLVFSGDLQTPTQLHALETEKAGVEQQIRAHDQELQRREQLIAQARAAAQAQAQAQVAQARAQAAAHAAAEVAAVTQASQAPKFGRLTLRALSGNLDVDGGGSLTGHGRSVELAFADKPGKIRVHAGQFSVVLMPKAGRRELGMDVTVSPMALITADGNRVGTSAENLKVGHRPYKLDFQSPVAGDLNLLLSYRK